MITVFLMTVTALTLNTFVGSGTAVADVPENSIAHVFLDIRNVSSDTLQSQYLTFLQSLRAAAGHEFRDGVQQTQTDTTNRLIRVDINDLRSSNPTEVRRMSLWLTPNNLYVVGFQNRMGLSWDFNDNTPRLDTTMQSIQNLGGIGPGNGGNLPSPGGYQSPLPFGGNYISLRRAAQRDRDAMPFSFQQLINSVNNLATTTDAPADSVNVARSLMFMIQFTSEAARFVPVQNFMRDNVLRDLSNNPPTTHGLPRLQQNLENYWARISQFAYQVTQNAHTHIPALVIPAVGTLHNFRDIQRLIAQLIGSTKQVPFSYSPDRSEL
jgi:hypothetical protein